MDIKQAPVFDTGVPYLDREMAQVLSFLEEDLLSGLKFVTLTVFGFRNDARDVALAVPDWAEQRNVAHAAVSKIFAMRKITSYFVVFEAWESEIDLKTGEKESRASILCFLAKPPGAEAVSWSFRLNDLDPTRRTIEAAPKRGAKLEGPMTTFLDRPPSA